MPVRVSPTETTPSHHLSLSDGSHTLGLILANGRGERDVRGIKQNGYPRSVTRISQNVAGYSDFELPYSPQVQQDWSGGRGLEDFDRDTTRFFDSYRADTTRGDIVCGPAATLTTGYCDTQSSSAANSQVMLSSDSSEVMASAFTASFTGTLRSVTVRVYGYDPASTPDGLQVAFFANTGGLPGAVLSTGSQTLPAGMLTNRSVTIPVNQAVTSGSTYWIGFSSNKPQVYVRVNNTTPAKNIYYATGPLVGILYPQLEHSEFTYTLSTAGNGTVRFFQYRGSLLAIQQPDDFTAPRLFLNGHHGMSTNNTDKTTLETTFGLWGNTGNVVRLVAGPGSEEVQNWRRMLGFYSEGVSTKVWVDPAWNVAHTTATEFATLGHNTWSEISGHGITKPVTDVLVVDDVIYFAQGDATVLRRGHYAAGSWAWANEGAANKATFLGLIPDAEGKKKVWLAQASTSKVSCSDAKAWGTDLAPLATWLTCGSTDSKITGLEAFAADGLLIPYILKEDGFGSIGGTTVDKVGVYAEHPLSAQIKMVRSEDNGRAHMRYDLFLKFSLLDGLESHFDQRLDDIGPNRDEGLPLTRRGPITFLLPYAGRFYAAVDGGVDGYSSILCCTQDNCWHEIYRAELTGYAIRSMAIQVIPGSQVDRLWFSEGENLYWLPVAIDPRKQTDYTYFSGAQVVTASIYCGFKDVTKYFDSLTLFAEGLSAGQTVAAAYQTDNEVGTDTWHPLPTTFTVSPAQAVKLSAANSVAGKRIRLRLILSTTDPTKTPRVKALRLDSVIRLKPKHMWTVTYLVKDNMTDLSGMPVAPITTGQPLPEDTQAWLDAFADSDTTACPVTLRHLRSMFDNKTVFVEPNSISPLTQVTTPNGETVQLGSFNLLEA
jgi:hypothetical protein